MTALNKTTFDENGVCVHIPLTDSERADIEARWAVVDTSPGAVMAERQKRLDAGFDHDFQDKRGVHRIGTTPEDMQGWAEVGTYAGALIDSGDFKATIRIVTDTGVCSVTGPEWRAVEIAAALFRQPIWAGSFALLSTDPIPTDFADDRHWA